MTHLQIHGMYVCMYMCVCTYLKAFKVPLNVRGCVMPECWSVRDAAKQETIHNLIYVNIVWRDIMLCIIQAAVIGL